MSTTPAAVLNFWFGPPDAPDAGKPRAAWFRRDADFDAQIRARFEPTVAAALAGELAGWTSSVTSALALMILLDQFPRNLYRNSAAAFAGDPAALDLAKQIIEQAWDRELAPLERLFCYLPFEHSEAPSDQKESLRLFTALAAEHPDCAGFLDYAQQHHELIVRFGRFPHRNAALGRSSTAEEIAYLAQPGAGF